MCLSGSATADRTGHSSVTKIFIIKNRNQPKVESGSSAMK
jgi:hypothetical protein